MSTTKPTVPAFDSLQKGADSEALPTELARYVAAVAGEAPSVHNTQPWRFRIEDGQFDLFADRTRQLNHLDPTGRLLTISCGAALDHAQLAIRGLGHTFNVQIFPDGLDAPESDHVARLTIAGTDHLAPTTGEWALLQAVTERSSYRGNFRQRLQGPLLEELHNAAADAGCNLYRVERPGQRAEVAGLIRTSEAMLEADPDFFRELRHWRAGETGSDDGIPGSALGIGRAGASEAAFPPRDFGLDDRGPDLLGLSASGEEIPVPPDVLAIWTTGDGAADWLRAGGALSRLLLTATCAGAAAGLLDQPLEVPQIRSRLTAALGVRGVVQVLLRIGYPISSPSPTPRRNVDDLLS